MKKGLEYFDVKFFLKFLTVFLCLNYFNNFYIGITAEGGRFYSSFLENNLNYVGAIRSGVLYASNALARLFALDTVLIAPYDIQIVEGGSVRMGYACIGLENISFWIAFVVTSINTIKRKLVWIVIGVLAICTINCLRVTLLLLLLKDKSNIPKFDNHHTLYNLAAYGVIAVMIYIFTSIKKNQFADSLEVNSVVVK